MKTAGRENPNRCATVHSNRDHRTAGQNRSLLNQVGCEARKTPAVGEVSFLDFTSYRTYQDKPLSRGQKLSRRGRSAGTNSFEFRSSPRGLSAVVPTRGRTRHPFAVSALKGSPQKIEFVYSCQSQNKSTRAAGAFAPSPSRLNGKTWQAVC